MCYRTWIWISEKLTPLAENTDIIAQNDGAAQTIVHRALIRGASLINGKIPSLVLLSRKSGGHSGDGEQSKEVLHKHVEDCLGSEVFLCVVVFNEL